MPRPETLGTPVRPPTRQRTVWQSRAVFPVLIFLIVAGFYWKLTLTKQYDWVWGPDLAQQVLPWFEEEARQVQHSELPLWDPHGWIGQSMIGQAQPGTAYPLNWILFLVPRFSGHIPIVALQWYFILIHFMAAIFCYLLCRDLGRSRPASLVAGLIFSLAAYVGTTDWPQMVNGAVWAPLVFLFLLRAVRGRRPVVSAALCGSAMGMSWLAGHHQVPIYITLTMAGTWLYCILRSGRINWSVVKLAAICFVFLFLVGALQILPAEEYGKLCKRWAGADHELTWNEAVPYYVHQQYSLGALSLFGIVIPGMNQHADPFIGTVAFSLALLAIALAWKRRVVRLFGLIAIGGLIYSLGSNSVFQGFLYALVPMVDKARVPSMAVVIFGFGAAVLAAFGLDYFAPERESVWIGRFTMGAFGFGVFLFLLVLGVTFGRNGFDRDDRVMVTALVSMLLAGLFYAWNSRNITGKQAWIFLTLLLLFELGNDSSYTFPHRANKERRQYFDQVSSNRDIANYIRQQPGTFRVEAENEQHLSPNWSEYFGFDAVKTLCATVTVNVMELEWHTWQSRMLLGVRYSVMDKPPLADSQEVFTGESGMKVYYNPGAFPRVWPVHQLIHIANAGEGRVRVDQHLDELHTAALTMEDLPALKTCSGPDDVAIRRYKGEEVIVDARMSCDGMIVLSDSYYPGWVAKVDGKTAPIHQVDIALRGVMVPQGKHELIMRYRPTSVYLGAALTLCGWLGAVALVIFGPKSREDASPEEF